MAHTYRRDKHTKISKSNKPYKQMLEDLRRIHPNLFNPYRTRY